MLSITIIISILLPNLLLLLPRKTFSYSYYGKIFLLHITISPSLKFNGYIFFNDCSMSSFEKKKNVQCNHVKHIFLQCWARIIISSPLPRRDRLSSLIFDAKTCQKWCGHACASTRFVLAGIPVAWSTAGEKTHLDVL